MPGSRQGYNISGEATYNSSYYGLKATVGYQNHNLFRGAERFDISLTGGYEFYNDRTVANAFEIGGATSITFPRFLTPFAVDRANRLYRPQSKMEISINYQHRPIYHRTISGANITYSWSDGRYNSYSVRPIETNLVRVSYVDAGFLSGITNQYLRESYRSQIINAISASYVHNNPKRNAMGNTLVFRLNLETAGNLSALVAGAVAGKKDYYDPLLIKYDERGDVLPQTPQKLYMIFKVPISQYARIDASISNKIMLGRTMAFVWRVFTGVGIAYGNSTSLPMDRLFYVGGANSMRGWLVRTLGPGSQKMPSGSYASQLGNLRLEANAEFRFPLIGSLHGATFLDAGNIWLMNMGGGDDVGMFRLNRFLKEVGDRKSVV
jgi:hypothetical protein